MKATALDISGCFLTQDTYRGSAWAPWTQHLYAYVGNNPVNWVDPTGHVVRTILSDIGGAWTDKDYADQDELRSEVAKQEFWNQEHQGSGQTTTDSSDERDVIDKLLNQSGSSSVKSIPSDSGSSEVLSAKYQLNTTGAKGSAAVLSSSFSGQTAPVANIGGNSVSFIGEMGQVGRGRGRWSKSDLGFGASLVTRGGRLGMEWRRWSKWLAITVCSWFIMGLVVSDPSFLSLLNESGTVFLAYWFVTAFSIGIFVMKVVVPFFRYRYGKRKGR